MTYKVDVKQEADGTLVMRYSGDAQYLVDACAHEARGNREAGGHRAMPDMRKIMRLDPVVLMDIAHRHGLDYYDPQVFEIAKGRDYSKFRTVNDRLLFRGK